MVHQEDDKELKLISPKKRKVHGTGTCDECGREVAVRWRFPKTNKGTVSLCGACKNDAFARSEMNETGQTYPGAGRNRGY